MHYLVQGDTAAVIKAVLIQNETGEAIPCQDHSVKLYVKAKRGSNILFTVTGVDGDLANGVVIFPLGSNMSTISSGYYTGEIEITYNSGLVESVYELVQMEVREEF